MSASKTVAGNHQPFSCAAYPGQLRCRFHFGFGLVNLANLERLYVSRNPLTGCSPAGLRRVTEHDLDELGLPYCDVLLRGLTISRGLLTPTFDSDHTDYVAAVDSAIVWAIQFAEVFVSK